MFSKLVTIVSLPKEGHPGVLQLVAGCKISQLRDIIERMGYIPTPFNKMSTNLVNGSNNVVVSIDTRSTEAHPKNSKPSFPGYITGGNKINYVVGETLPMLTNIAICLPKAS